LESLGTKTFGAFHKIWYWYCHYGIFCGLLLIFCGHFGIIFPIWVGHSKINLATLLSCQSAWRRFLWRQNTQFGKVAKDASGRVPTPWSVFGGAEA
jgi:hypothetical protein